MISYLQLIVLGLGLGGAYALLALGVVTIYRGTGVPNFAQAAIAMAAAYMFFGLRDQRAMSPLLAFVLTCLFAIALGVGFHFAVMRQLRRSPILARIVATVAFALLLRGIVLTFFDVSTRTPKTVLPTGITTFGSVNISNDRLYLAGVAVLAAIVLGVVSRYTKLGLAIRATAESEKGAQLLGYSPNVLSVITWGVGSLLAAIAGVLLSPMAGLDAVALQLLVVPVFGAALIARFSSYSVAVIAGLAIGAAQSVLQKWSQPSDWWTTLWAGPGRQQALPAFVIIVAMIISGRLIPSRGELKTGRPPLSPEPRRMVVGPLVLLALGAVFFLFASSSWVYAGTTTVIGGLIILSLVVLTGFLGQVSLAQMAFAGVGGLVAAKVAGVWDLPFLLVLVLGGIAASGLGFLIGLPALRVRGPALAIVTLSAALIFEKFFFQDLRIVGGDGSVAVPAPALFGWKLEQRAFGIACLIIAVGAGVAVAALRRSRFGRRMLALRENERAGAAAGVSTSAYKLATFSFSAFIAGVGGALLGYQQGVFAPERFTVFESLALVVLAYIGGIAMVAGAIFAGIGVTGGLFAKLLGDVGLSSYHEIIAGGTLLIAIQLHQDGLASLPAEIRHRRAQRRRLGDGRDEAAAVVDLDALAEGSAPPDPVTNPEDAVPVADVPVPKHVH